MIKLKRVTTRSPEENRYYHGVVVADVADFKGWSAPKTHEWIKETFGIVSTSNLTTDRFEALMDYVRNHCLEHWGLEISLPKK